MKIGFHVARAIRIAVLACMLVTVSLAAHANSDDKASFLQTPAMVHYDNALGLIQAASYKEALSLLRRLQAYYPGFEKLSAVQTRIAVLQESDDASLEIGHYLDALDKRDAGDANAALSSLDFILQQYPQSSLADDALYLKAYVQIMDRYDFIAAQQTLARLQQTHPESSYQDSADYLNAIALEQLGQTAEAKAALEALRDRHTAFSLPFGYSWPAGNVLSRYWYDRADKRLDIMYQTDASASQLRSKLSLDSGGLAIGVNVDGVDLELELTQSPLTRETAWRDGQMQNQSPPVAGVFVGTVAGDADSWVRAVVVDETISGLVYAFGRTYTMSPGTLIGTLDYYKPRSAKQRAAGAADGVSTRANLGRDAIKPPPALGAAHGGVSEASSLSDLRVIPVSIVIDAEFDRYHGGNGLVVALNQLNVADGIYRQFGMAIAIDEVQVFGDNDPSPTQDAPASLESYLLTFRGYRQDNRTLFNDSVLTYLFTGKQRTDRTLGLAWIDTLCRVDGYDVGVTTPSAIGEVLLTHELGHSLGSQHDSDTSCNQDTTKIMWPNISTRTQVEFSPCSHVSVSNARAKSCLVNSIDVSVNATGTGSGVDLTVNNLDTQVAIETNLLVETSVAGMLNLPAGCNAVTPTSTQCVLGQLAASEQRSLSFQVINPGDNANALVSAQVSTPGSSDFNPVDNVVSYSIDTQSITSDHLILATNVSTDGVLSATQTVSEPAAGSSGSMSTTGLLVLSLVQFISALKYYRTAKPNN